MALISGFTTFGIVRKRMADLYVDFATRIKEGGVFGTQTTADLPDTFPSDPLVQIMTTTSASLHEVWEAVELWYQQLDPNTATGVYLDYLHGSRVGIAREIGQSDIDYRAAIRSALMRPNRSDVTMVAASVTGVDCAVLISSRLDEPVEGVPAPGNLLVIKGQFDPAELAEALYNHVELGLHQFYGSGIASFVTDSGSCVSYRYAPAQPLGVAMHVKGYFDSLCVASTYIGLPALIAEHMRSRFPVCNIGAPISAAQVLATLGEIEGFTATGVTFARRPRMLWVDGCPQEDAPRVIVDDAEIVWATTETCGIEAGEVWCPPDEQCLLIRPWEYPLFDQQFITVEDDPTHGGCL